MQFALEIETRFLFGCVIYAIEYCFLLIFQLTPPSSPDARDGTQTERNDGQFETFKALLLQRPQGCILTRQPNPDHEIFHFLEY